jgi:cytochrome oxidase assembly protein ShyY1
VYRFVLTPRWLGYALLTVVLATVMVLLGFWQLDRYHQRSAVNARIDAASRTPPVQLATVLPAPTGRAGSTGPAPSSGATWTRVSVAGRYDPSHEILVRARTVDDRVGFEVVTPLVLGDGTAMLVDRGWVAPARGAATLKPVVPAAPTGDVTVVGWLRAPESGADQPQKIEGQLEVRRIAPTAMASTMPYPVWGGYVTLDEQVPPADQRLVPIPPDHQNALQNGGYVIQWWLFAAIAVGGFGYLVRREAHDAMSAAQGTDRIDGVRLRG